MSTRRRSVERALDDRRVRNVLVGADVMHSAVRSSRGPHLTPTAVSWEADRLWAVAPKDSVKVRALRKDPLVGALLSVDGFHVVAAGVVKLVSRSAHGCSAWRSPMRTLRTSCRCRSSATDGCWPRT